MIYSIIKFGSKIHILVDFKLWREVFFSAGIYHMSGAKSEKKKN